MQNFRKKTKNGLGKRYR